MDSSFFVTGGSLRADTPSYVERRADRELLDGLLGGEFCYVLTARQMGKSSLMVRTAQKLREAGVGVAVLDLTGIGQNLSAEQWYYSLLFRLADQLDLVDEADRFWDGHPRLGPLHRFIAALEHVVLSGVQAFGCSGVGQESPQHPNTATPQHPSLVLFVDEIDVVRSLSFSTDEFFAAIRECYNRRTEDPAFRRLTFCLLGVAAPQDLIRDTRITPFNIGRRIELTDFTPAEAAPLASGLGRWALGKGSARPLLKRVLHWTGGHPYLTQRLCKAVAERMKDEGGRMKVPPAPLHPSSFIPHPSEVDRLCAELFLSHGAQEKDDNLIFVRERLLRSECEPAAVLDLYARVR